MVQVGRLQSTDKEAINGAPHDALESRRRTKSEGNGRIDEPQTSDSNQ